MNLLNESSNILMGWWPVVISLWGIVTTVLGLYSRIINIRLTGVSDDLHKAVKSLDDDIHNTRKDLNDANDRAAALQKAFTDYQMEVLRTYMPAVDVKSMVDELKAYLIRIEDKVDGRKPQ